MPAKGCHHTAESRQKMSLAWRNRARASEETRRKMSLSHTGKKHSEESIKRMSKVQKGHPISDETREKISSAHIGKGHSEDTKKKLSELGKGRKHTPEEKKKISESNKGKVITEDMRKQIANTLRGRYAGPDNPNWKGGKTFEPYCFRFNRAFKEYIRAKFGRKCFICGTPENCKGLQVHHIDYNKNSICNGQEWAFLPLCPKCHSKTNFNRWHWFNLLMNYWVSGYISEGFIVWDF